MNIEATYQSAKWAHIDTPAGGILLVRKTKKPAEVYLPPGSRAVRAFLNATLEPDAMEDRASRPAGYYEKVFNRACDQYSAKLKRR